TPVTTRHYVSAHNQEETLTNGAMPFARGLVRFGNIDRFGAVVGSCAAGPDGGAGPKQREDQQMMPSARWIGAALLAVLLSGASAPRAQECDSSVAPNEGCHHRQLPQVYSVENTGARYAAPTFPPFAQLPIVRPLPDPFTFFDGSHRDASAASWERRRNEIKAAIEKYEIGPKPDCSDCTITASYTPPAAGSNTGALTVVV